MVVSDGTGTLSAADLAAITAKTTGTVTLQNAQTVSGTGDEVTAALITDPLTLSAASNATVTGNVTAQVAGNIANVTDITAAFSGTITDTLANLADSGSITTNFSREEVMILM